MASIVVPKHRPNTRTHGCRSREPQGLFIPANCAGCWQPQSAAHNVLCRNGKQCPSCRNNCEPGKLLGCCHGTSLLQKFWRRTPFWVECFQVVLQPWLRCSRASLHSSACRQGNLCPGMQVGGAACLCVQTNDPCDHHESNLMRQKQHAVAHLMC